ncbi:uncharacterized protein LOC113874392 [Abrus precatorius]|uniref:Uncharacterized protein LOC113874392 n=1 Tax=Abrus precatorius TaxID=3816 RepID=A0A8B8MI66_ABRPR|nr:uncharacterized protein LOC113874392 [Abrus precatorius]
MKGSLHVADNTHKLPTSLSMSNLNHPFIQCQSHVSPSNVKVPLDSKFRGLNFKVSLFWPNHSSCVVKRQKGSNEFVVGCASWGLEREFKAEMKKQENEEKGKNGMGRFRHKCGEREGVVELLECLEREAIMGDDVGKEPTDYNRRAQIFDRSSQVFQAMKELNNDVLTQ